MNNKIKNIISFLFVLFIGLGVVPTDKALAEESEKHIIFADAGWDSARFHNAMAGLVAEEVFGYTFEELTGGTTILHEGLLSGEIDVHMEVWTDNIASYMRDIEENKLVELGTNFDDNNQGIYVPRYVVEGDPERGIEPMAPDLKTVKDLKKYSDVFQDEEKPEMGRLYGSIPGWEVDKIMFNKYNAYGLDSNFVYFRPGSEASLGASISNAYEKGEPIAAYYWEPTWLTGKYDMVLLEDDPYDPDKYKDGIGELPSVDVVIGASNEFNDNNPEFVEFLKKYETSSALTSEALAYMQDTGADYKETAVWFINQNPDLVRSWLSEENGDKLFTDLGIGAEAKKSYFKEFPFTFDVNLNAIDDSIRNFSEKYDGFFSKIRQGLIGQINFTENVLNFIPWFVFIILVFILGYKTSSLLTGILYAALLSFIGFMGYWTMMTETLSIVITSVIISLVLGFPIGILVSKGERADTIMRPILDTMQTMPVFVYLIPALLFFGLGKAPAVIATTIYSIVPMIRMTSHGIKQIDEEVIEASKAFGSTYMQSLVKVMIPQALPTILTGVNQTIMMAMAMVVTTSMIGAGGLGMEVLNSVNRIEIGRGIVSGTSVVIVAILLDRLSQAWFTDKEDNGIES